MDAVLQRYVLHKKKTLFFHCQAYMGNFCIPTPTFLQQYARMLHVADGCYDSYSLYMAVLMFSEYREVVLPRASMHNSPNTCVKRANENARKYF